jgi:DNA-binding XRE family transcriptional regulator
MTTAVNGYRIPQWDFSDRLRKIRREVAHLTQEQMATELGASQRAYAAWETGRTKPDDIVAVAKRIALRWGIPPTWTLGLDDGPSGGGGASAPIPAELSPLPGLNRGPLAYLVPTRPAPLQRAA